MKYWETIVLCKRNVGGFNWKVSWRQQQTLKQSTPDRERRELVWETSNCLWFRVLVATVKSQFLDPQFCEPLDCLNQNSFALDSVKQFNFFEPISVSLGGLKNQDSTVLPEIDNTEKQHYIVIRMQVFLSKPNHLDTCRMSFCKTGQENR